MNAKNIVVFASCLSLLMGCGEEYIAKVNGKGIEANAFKGYLELENIDAHSEEEKQKALDKFLQAEALADIVEKKLLQIDPIVGAEIREQKKEILITRYFDNYLKEKVNEQRITDFYKSNIDQFQEKKIHLAHILFRLNRSMDETQRKEKHAEAQEVLKKLENGLDFAVAAKNYSEDKASASKGGDLGWLVHESIDRTFSTKVFALKKDELSQIIETPLGYHILKALDNVQTSAKSLDAVKGQIRYRLREEAENAERKRLLDQVKIVKG